MYSTFLGYLGTTANLDPLAKSDLYPSVRGELGHVDHPFVIGVSTVVVVVTLVNVDVVIVVTVDSVVADVVLIVVVACICVVV